MANVLDLRRRIRSVKNTRQITKAMKMVSAAKLRRAQERAMPARPYAQMITNVLESLVPPHDLTMRDRESCTRCLAREEKRVLLIVVAATRALPARSTRTSPRRAFQFIAAIAGRPPEVDVEAIGRKGRDLLRSADFPVALYEKTEEHYDNDRCSASRSVRNERSQSRSRANIRRMLLKLDSKSKSSNGSLRALFRAICTRRSTPPTSSTTNSSP